MLSLSFASPGTDLHELKTYVTSRLLWDSDRDPLAEIAAFTVLYCARLLQRCESPAMAL